ncbi:MAG: hypothetical protein K0U63_09535 [Cyanobacteria bacterium]|nr:hypothetical protein [Cyanobacteriota bacterium]
MDGVRPLTAHPRRPLPSSVIATVMLGLKGPDRQALFAAFKIWTRGLFCLPLRLLVRASCVHPAAA